MPVENLSTGVIRRASLARALMHSPQILLIDEPAGGLDQETADAIQSLLAFVGREEGVTLFLCSSNMDLSLIHISPSGGNPPRIPAPWAPWR